MLEVEATFQPLYGQVKNLMTQRISSGRWQPGELLPNEFQLAAEFSVSQGTVRKALIALEADKLIVRQQGRGTYVSRHTGQQMLFRFFRLQGDGDKPLAPSSRPLSQTQVKATAEQAQLLGVRPGQLLHLVTRIRAFDGDPAIFERVYVPVTLMPSLSVTLGMDMIDEMYVIYQQRFQITISQASEKLRAVAATREEMQHLGVEKNYPLLEIVRQARDINGKVVELRVSHCKTTAYTYVSEVT